MINLKNFESNLLKIDKKSSKNIDIYNTGYITIKKTDDYESIYSVYPLYLRDNHANGYIDKKKTKKNENNYLIVDSPDENEELLKKYSDVWKGSKNKINAINVSKYDYEKDFMKIKFNSDDDLPLNKPLKLHSMTISIRSVFEEHGKLYRQVFLDDVCMN